MMSSHVILPIALMLSVPTDRPAKPLNKSVPTAHKAFGSAQSSAIVDDAGVQGGKALRITVTQDGTKPWSAGANSFIGGTIKAGSPIEAVVWLRVAKPSGQSARMAAMIQESEGSRRELVKQEFEISGDWAPYRLTLVAPADLQPYSTTLSLYVGYARQAIDIGPMMVTAGKPAA